MRRIVGTRAEVTAQLWEMRQGGADPVLSSPRVLPDGRWQVDVTVHAPPPPRQHPDKLTGPQRRRLAGWWCAAAAAVAGCVVLGVAAWLVATWMLEHVAQLIGALAVAVLVVAGLAGVVGGRGHCSGPNSGH